MTCQHCYGIGYDASGYTCTCVPPAVVAKVGRKYYDRDALRGSPWRVYVKHLAKWLLFCLAVLFAAALFTGVTNA